MNSNIYDNKELQEYIESQEADRYLSSMEASEREWLDLTV